MPEPTSHLRSVPGGALDFAGAPAAHHRAARAPAGAGIRSKSCAGRWRRNFRKHHLVRLIGPRGIGKTHLLSLIEDEIAAVVRLGCRLRGSAFSRESTARCRSRTFLPWPLRNSGDTLGMNRSGQSCINGCARRKTMPPSSIPRARHPPAEPRARPHLLVMLENLGELFTGRSRKRHDIAPAASCHGRQRLSGWWPPRRPAFRCDPPAVRNRFTNFFRCQMSRKSERDGKRSISSGAILEWEQAR